MSFLFGSTTSKTEADPWDNDDIFRDLDEYATFLIRENVSMYPKFASPRTLLPQKEVFKRLREFAGPSWTWICPDNVRDWPESLVWAGGSLLTCLDAEINIADVNKNSRSQDIDLWYCFSKVQSADQVKIGLEKILRMLIGNHKVTMVIKNSIITLIGPHEEDRNIQLIITHTLPQYVACTFDMPHVTGYFNGGNLVLSSEMWTALLERKIHISANTLAAYRPWKWLKLDRYGIIPSNLKDLRRHFEMVYPTAFADLPENSSEEVWWNNLVQEWKQDPVTLRRVKQGSFRVVGGFDSNTVVNCIKFFQPELATTDIDTCVEEFSYCPMDNGEYVMGEHWLNLEESIQTCQVTLGVWADQIKKVPGNVKEACSEIIHVTQLKISLPEMDSSAIRIFNDQQLLRPPQRKPITFELTDLADRDYILGFYKVISATLSAVNLHPVTLVSTERQAEIESVNDFIASAVKKLNIQDWSQAKDKILEINSAVEAEAERRLSEKNHTHRTWVHAPMTVNQSGSIKELFNLECSQDKSFVHPPSDCKYRFHYTIYGIHISTNTPTCQITGVTKSS